MAQRRTKTMNIYIEPMLHAAIEAAATSKSQSISDFARSCIIKQLEEMGLLTDGVAIAIMT